MIKSVYCTVLSSKRLIQGIACYLSLFTVMKDFRLFILCVDDKSYQFMRDFKLPQIVCVRLDELNRRDIMEIKNSRKLNQYCWTLKPVFIRYILEHSRKIQRITYIDSDLYFLQNPEVIFENQPDKSVLLSDGKIFIPKCSREFISYVQSKTGNYNSGFISFKRDENGIACASWWDDRCMESCTEKPEDGIFGDQKYLDYMPCLFDNVGEITTPGVNIGHWNSQKYDFSVRNDEIMANNYKLIVYHFSGFRIINKYNMVQIHERERVNLPFIYDIYKKFLSDIIDEIEVLNPYYKDYFITSDIDSN
ncbi:MAG: putative nucleotide-diphospho-sugar transferase [Clostridium sp.]|nr:putative nucleotide-diphospho-sugar transferase [Clostridium sp.]